MSSCREVRLNVNEHLTPPLLSNLLIIAGVILLFVDFQRIHLTRTEQTKHFLTASLKLDEAFALIGTGAFLIITSPMRSSRSDIRRCAEAARSSATFVCVTLTVRLYRSIFPRSSLIGLNPDDPIVN